MKHEHPPIVLARYAMVSAVMANTLTGMSLAEAIAQVSEMSFFDVNGRRIRVSARTLYRQIKSYDTRGIAGLYNKDRTKAAASSVLSDDFLRYLHRHKTDDPEASLPNIISCAEIEGIIESGSVSRSTVWRAAHKMGLPLFASKAPKNDDMRRWRYAHRMQMIMIDGLHFRAGVHRAERVALFFLDDATRYGLDVLVVTAENAADVLRGLFSVLTHYGRIGTLFLDRGPGFIAKALARVCVNLNTPLILGTAGYPEARGAIERFNRTARAGIIRTFDGDPAIDPSCAVLTQRLRHYLRAVYNLDEHEGLDKRTPTPQARWDADSAQLQYFDDLEMLSSQFIVSTDRKVSRDNIIRYDGKFFETPCGYAGTHVLVYRHLLHGTVSLIHQGRMVELHEVDMTANACHQRRRAWAASPRPDLLRTTKTAARLAYDRDHATIIDAQGNFPDTENTFNKE